MSFTQWTTADRGTLNSILDYVKSLSTPADAPASPLLLEIRDQLARLVAATVRDPAAGPVPQLVGDSSNTANQPYVPPAPPPPSARDHSIENYWNMRPPFARAFRKLLSGPNGNIDTAARTTRAQALFDMGVVGVDPAIEVDGADPVSVMRERVADGYTWVPAFGQPVPLSVPGTTNASAPPYDPDNPPAGSIIVTLDFLDPLDK